MSKQKTKKSKEINQAVPSVNKEKMSLKKEAPLVEAPLIVENRCCYKILQYLILLKTLLKRNLSTVWSWGILSAWIAFTVFSFCALYYWSNMFQIIEVVPYQFSVSEKLSPKLVCELTHPVTGVCLQSNEEKLISDEELETAKVFTVMVENHTAARPQSGLGEAIVVYEALVEGGFTRFMAVFDSLQTVKSIGPVRSARDYYLWWAKEYNNPLYAHVGGSPKSLSLIASQGMIDCDEFYHGNIFERVSWRSAPHNTYVSVANLGLCRPTKPEAGLLTAIDAWSFVSEELPDDLIKVENLEISYSQNANYQVEWQYNAEEGLYYRFNGGQPHLDKNSNQQITAKNVIVMEALSRVIDDIGRLEMNNIGSGPVLIYTQGTKQKGEWQKDHYSDRTRFVDKEGNNLLLSSGNTWIQVVPSYFNAITEK